MSRVVLHYVKIVRSDGSVTYKGAWSLARCEREAAVWRREFPGYEVRVAPVAVLRDEVRAWAKAIAANGGLPYFPAKPVGARS